MQRSLYLKAALVVAASSMSGCSSPSPPETQAASSIGADEAVKFGGNEPFWGGEVRGNSLTYTTPENPDGAMIDVTARAGLGGISWTGELDGAAFILAVSDLECSDGMSDRTYALTATLKLGSDETRQGCAWTESRPYSGEE